jgi:dGTPase
MKSLYTKNDQKRHTDEPVGRLGYEEYRNPFRRDYARLIHSPAFRRLQDCKIYRN